MIPNTNVLNDRWIGSHTLPDSYPFFFLQSQQRWPILWYRKGTFSELQLIFFKYLHNVSSAERTRHMSYHADLWFGNKCIYRTCPVPTSQVSQSIRQSSIILENLVHGFKCESTVYPICPGDENVLSYTAIHRRPVIFKDYGGVVSLPYHYNGSSNLIPSAQRMGSIKDT